jgi:hypothetical protein
LPILGLQNSQNISSYGRVSYPTTLRPLHVDGNKVLDDVGKEIFLRGIGRSGLQVPEGNPGMSQSDVSSGNYGSLITEQDFVTMQSWGVNVVRLCFGWGWLEPTRGTYNIQYVHRLEQVINWINNHNMYVIVNNHMASFRDGKGGWTPPWISDPEFWESADLQQAFIDSWVWLANRWKNNSGIAAYDLFNEPTSPAWSSQYGGDMAKSKVIDILFRDNGLYERTIKAIRNVGDNHICIVQPYGGDQPDVPNNEKPPINDENIMYTFHPYPLEKPNFQYEPWYNMLLSTWSQRKQNWNLPIYVGEFGVPWRLTNYTEDDCVNWTQRLCEDFKSRGFHWTYWSFKWDKNALYYIDEGSNIYDPGGERPIVDVLKGYFVGLT